MDEHPVAGSATLERYAGDAAGIRVRITHRWVFAVAAALFLLFTVPLAVFVPERAVARPERLSFAVAAGGFRGVFATLRSLPKHRNILLFLLGNFLCVDVLNTAIQWFSTYFTGVFAFTGGQILLLGVGMSGGAFAAGLSMGKVTDWFGARRAMLAAAALLSAALVCVGLAPNAAFAVSCILGPGALGLAGLWVAGRKLLIELAPPEKLGEFFGLYGIAIKISVVGTTAFAVLSDVLARVPSLAEGAWNFRIAILVQLVMILPGLFLLSRIRSPAAAAASPGPGAAPAA
jgi:UMF1 family MFS transporter